GVRPDPPDPVVSGRADDEVLGPDAGPGRRVGRAPRGVRGRAARDRIQRELPARAAPLHAHGRSPADLQGTGAGSHHGTTGERGRAGLPLPRHAAAATGLSLEERIRSDLSVWELRSSKGRIWQAIRWIHRRRPLLTALLVLIAPAHTLVSGAEPVDLLSMRVNARFLFAWILMLFGFGVRLWGSGNLRKNQEITCSGIYVLVRHPL